MVRQIKRRYTTIMKKIESLEQEINELQEECPHANVTIKHDSNTGNYDPTADSYWIDFHCQDCDKRWRTPQ